MTTDPTFSDDPPRLDDLLAKFRQQLEDGAAPDPASFVLDNIPAARDAEMRLEQLAIRYYLEQLPDPAEAAPPPPEPAKILPPPSASAPPAFSGLARFVLAATVLILLSGAVWGVVSLQDAATRARQAEQVSRDLRASKDAELRAIALLDRAWYSLRSTHRDRRDQFDQARTEADKEIRQVADPTRRDYLDLRRWSLQVEALRVLDPAPTDGDRDFLGMPQSFPAYNAALDPAGDRLAVGRPDAPVVWRRGQPKPAVPNLPNDMAHLRSRVLYNGDGSLLAFAPDTGGLRVYDGDGKAVIKNLDADTDRRYLALVFLDKALWGFRDDGRLRAWALPDGKETASISVVEVKPGRVPVAALSAAADRLLIAEAGPNPRVLLAEPGKDGKWTLRPAGTFRERIFSLAIAPDGESFAVGASDGSATALDRQGVLLHRWEACTAGVTHLTYSPDSRVLFVGAAWAETEQKVFDVHTGNQLAHGPIPASFARDGERCAVVSTRGVGFGRYLMPRAYATLTGHRADVAHLSWSRDKKHFATIDGRKEIRVWHAETRRLVRVITPPPKADAWHAAQSRISLSDDGRLLAFADGGQREAVIHIYNVADGVETDSWTLKGGGFDHLTADGAERFLWLREESERGTAVLHTVVREVTASVGGKKGTLSAKKVVRPSRPTDEGLYLEASISADGRFYAVAVPRFPEAKRRVEVRRIATGELVWEYAVPATAGEPGVTLSPDGATAWLEHRDRVRLRFDLTQPKVPGVAVSRCPATVAPARGIEATELPAGSESNPWFLEVLALTRGDQPMLHLTGESIPTASIRFSADGRYLAFARRNAVYLLDLDAIGREVPEVGKLLGGR